MAFGTCWLACVPDHMSVFRIAMQPCLRLVPRMPVGTLDGLLRSTNCLSVVVCADDGSWVVASPHGLHEGSDTDT